jgi:hypothetical protein
VTSSCVAARFERFAAAPEKMGISAALAQSIHRHRIRGPVALIVMLLVAGCHWDTAFERLQEARRLAADLLVQFLKASDAGNRAVMADTDEASVAFAREARGATEAAQNDADTLALLLQSLGLSSEARLLDEFRTKFAEYRALDRSILDLAVENTNLKAQRLSFGSAREAADALQESLDAVVRSAPAKDSWHVNALAATAMASAREIQALEAPHIAEADDGAMTRLEKRMAAAEATARNALETLEGLIPPASRPRLAAADAAFNRLIGVNAQIVRLSRRNSNVRSLALSLNQKRTLAAACEASLRAVRDGLAKRGFTGTR